MNRYSTSLIKPNVHRFHTALKGLGVNLSDIYQSLGINPDNMEDESASLPMAKYLQLLNAAAEQLGDPHLAATMALNNSNNNLGLLTYLMLNAPDFASVIRIIHRYVVLVAPGSEIDLIQGQHSCILSYRVNGTTADQARQDVEGTIAQFTVLIRVLLQDEQWTPDKIYFEHSPSDPQNPQTFPIASSIQYEHYLNGIEFPAEFIRVANREYDEKLLALLEAQAHEQASQFTQHSSLLEQVRLLINSTLGFREVTADSIARELGMSRRTLNRRLSDYDTSFNTLREDIVYQLAKERLLNSNISITELAQQLGYSDSSSFNRVFKRLSGSSPLQYRKAVR